MKLLKQLKFNLSQAQAQMSFQANKHRRELVFKVGDEVLRKLCPYRQAYYQGQNFSEISHSFLWSFPNSWTCWIGGISIETTCWYQDSLSQQQKLQGQHTSTVPHELAITNPIQFLPEAILKHCSIIKDNAPCEQLLIQWISIPTEESIWIDLNYFKGQFPFFQPWGQGCPFKGQQWWAGRTRPWENAYMAGLF